VHEHGGASHFSKSHFIVRQNGQVQDGYGGKDLLLEFLVDGAVEGIFHKVGSTLMIRLSDLGLC
jgi:hypothetical protein